MVLCQKKAFSSPATIIPAGHKAVDLRPGSPRAPHHNYASSPACSIGSSGGDQAWIAQETMDQIRQLSDNLHLSAPQNGDQSSQGVRFLPPGCEVGNLVGEGAANAVFEIHLSKGSYPCHQNSRLLLRVAKTPVGGERPRFNYLEQYQYYINRIQPILGSYILHQELVSLKNADIIRPINKYLQDKNHLRNPKFRDSFIEPSDWGFLVEDMRPHDPKNTILVEFKPKWLSQSPNAPKNAIRCRQCAKELYSFIVEPQLDKPVPTSAKPCPLMIGTDEKNPDFTETLSRLLPDIETGGEHLNNTLDVLRSEAAFKKLRQAQEENDCVGPLKADEKDDSFALAMTLRDCTCFAQVSTSPSPSRDSSRPLKIKFGDFDMKSPEFRLSYWRNIEQELIDGGFYTADWIYCRGKLYQPPTKCYLERSQPSKPTEESEIIYLREKYQSNGIDALPTHKKARAHDIKTDVGLLMQSLASYMLQSSSPPLRPSKPQSHVRS